MSWWVLTYHENDRSLHHLHVLARTNHPAHMFMAWGKFKPSRTPVYRSIRGKLIHCGFKHVWDTPHIVEQNQSLDTFTHTFGPITLASTDHVWYFLFSPKLLVERFCQSALFHVWPPEAHVWTNKMYVGTQLKGVFYTETFTGPGGTHPVWQTFSSGLLSFKIWQLEPDPLGLAYRLYALAGAPGNRILYERLPLFSPNWIPLLTNAAAVALTGSTSGELCWVTTNIHQPGHLYVLFNSAFGDNGTWCLRSEDYGQTWTAHQIYAGALNANAGNISIGLAQGTSPYNPGTVLYTVLNAFITWPMVLYRSLDDGQTWAVTDFQGVGLLTPRCLVDPTDQSIVYAGAVRDIANVHELWRAENHGFPLVEVDGAHHLGIMIEPYRAEMWINPTDQSFITVLENNHLYITIDYCTTWVDTGLIAHSCSRLALLWENPDRFYLARHTSGALPPPASNSHVIFVSEDYGATMYGKSGAWSFQDDGHGNSIPYNCGGVCLQGMQLFPPY